MRIFILLFSLLSSAGAFAQDVQHHAPHSRQVGDSSTRDVEQYSNLAGYWSLATVDPLIVNADPLISSPTFTATVKPRPATTFLTVDFGDEMPEGRITVAISDTISNKLLKSASFIPNSTEHSVTLEGLKTGSYHVVVFRDDKRVLYMGGFRKE